MNGPDKIECNSCFRDISDDPDVYCVNCYDEASEPETEYVDVLPEQDSCRRCDQLRYLDEDGYCSDECALGFTPMPYQTKGEGKDATTL